MLDAAIQTLIQSALISGLALRGVAVDVAQNEQPRQFAAPSTPTIFHTLGSRKPFGWPTYKDVVNPDTTTSTTCTQVMHTRFQIAGCVPNASPANPNGYTSGDISNIARSILQHELTLAQFIANDCNVFRVQDNPLVWFQDSSAQNVAWASFDIIFTHKDVFTAPATAAISSINQNVTNV